LPGGTPSGSVGGSSDNASPCSGRPSNTLIEDYVGAAGPRTTSHASLAALAMSTRERGMAVGQRADDEVPSDLADSVHAVGPGREVVPGGGQGCSLSDPIDPSRPVDGLDLATPVKDAEGGSLVLATVST